MVVVDAPEYGVETGEEGGFHGGVRSRGRFGKVHDIVHFVAVVRPSLFCPITDSSFSTDSI